MYPLPPAQGEKPLIMHQAKGLDIGIDHKWNIKQPCFRVVSIWKTNKKLQYLNTRFFKARKGQGFLKQAGTPAQFQSALGTLVRGRGANTPKRFFGVELGQKKNLTAEVSNWAVIPNDQVHSYITGMNKHAIHQSRALKLGWSFGFWLWLKIRSNAESSQT